MDRERVTHYATTSHAERLKAGMRRISELRQQIEHAYRELAAAVRDAHEAA